LNGKKKILGRRRREKVYQRVCVRNQRGKDEIRIVRKYNMGQLLKDVKASYGRKEKERFVSQKSGVKSQN